MTELEEEMMLAINEQYGIYVAKKIDYILERMQLEMPETVEKGNEFIVTINQPSHDDIDINHQDGKIIVSFTAGPINMIYHRPTRQFYKTFYTEDVFGTLESDADNCNESEIQEKIKKIAMEKRLTDINNIN